MTLELMDISIRLATAAALGGAVGIDRELQQKPAGFRTHAMVSLGAALLTVAGLSLAAQDGTAVSRVLQGLVAGIGFVGGGTILRTNSGEGVQGLTTATSLWVVAAVGITAGLGRWDAALVATVLAIALLSLGEKFERWLHRVARRREDK